MDIVLYIIGLLTICIGLVIFVIWQANYCFSSLTNKIEAMALKLSDVETALTDLESSIDTEGSEVSAEIAKLREEIANGGTEEEIQAILDRIAALKGKVAGIVTPTTETPEVPEEPTPEV